MKRGDGLTLDGAGWAFPWENDSSQLTIAQVKQALKLSQQIGLAYVGLWRKQRQGVEQTRVDPDYRNYEVPTAEQATIEIELLRYGLSEN